MKPVVAQGQPELESSEGSRKLNRFFEEGKPLDGIVGESAGVFSGVRKGALRCGCVPVEQATASGWLIEPFVRIKGERVGALQSSKRIGNRQGCERTISAVNMQPKSEFPAYVRDCAERIDAPSRGGSRACNDGNWQLAILQVQSDLPPKVLRSHAERFVHWNQSN